MPPPGARKILQDSPEIFETRSTTDVVFDRLYQEIINLDLLPGSKMSEAVVGRRFGVSRQPVRDAFKRLGSLDLLEIRPQRATRVRRFSMAEIENTRFLRMAVELEIIDRACAVQDARFSDALAQSLARQQDALDAGDIEAFHAIDYDFHKLICEFSGRPMAYDMIEQCKRKVDRLCVLSLAHDSAVSEVLQDHREIAEALAQRSVSAARAATRKHLARLDSTITEIFETHSEYFHQ